MPNLDCCPACNASLVEHEPENGDNFEFWNFGCGAEIVNENGKLVANEPCREALEVALLRLNP